MSYKDEVAARYGVPPELLDSVMWVQGADGQARAEQIAQGLKSAYSKTNDWGPAIGQYWTASGGDPSSVVAFTDQVLQAGGYLDMTQGVPGGVPTASGEDLLGQKGKGWLDSMQEAVTGGFGKVVDTVGGVIDKVSPVPRIYRAVTSGDVTELAGGKGGIGALTGNIGFVVLGIAIIIVALLAFKPVRDVATTAIKKGAK